MNTVKKFTAWLLGPKSDIVLFAIALILLNLVAGNAYLRFDLTAPQSYSLSEASSRLVSTLEEPLKVNVFFTSKLPAPYNSMERYLKDLLSEYKAASKGKLEYTFFDMEVSENKDLALDLGVVPVQIQEVKEDAVGLTNAYMGLVLLYSDSMETLGDLSSSEGLEYRLTTAMGKMISRTSTLAGLSERVKLTLYASSSLKSFRINGFDNLEQDVRAIFNIVNQNNQGKLDFHRLDPTDPVEIQQLSERYGLNVISWKSETGNGAGLLDLVLELGDKFRTISLPVARSLFGGYVLGGIDTLEEELNASLQALVSNSSQIGYLVGHQEKDLNDEQQGGALFKYITSDMYELVELKLDEKQIPANITSIVISGPRYTFTEAELYKLDQYVLKGGNLLFFADPFEEAQTYTEQYYGNTGPTYRPITTGMEGLLERWGLKLSNAYVLDEEAYKARDPNMGEVPLNYAPMIQQAGINQKHSISRNLGNLIFLKSGALEFVPDMPDSIRQIPLIQSSPNAWLMSGQINLTPFSMIKPSSDKLAVRNLAVLLEGQFESAFDGVPASLQNQEEGEAELDTATHLSKSVLPARIVVFGSSELVGPSLIDQSGRQPVAVLVRNALDYISGNEDLAAMRTKGLGMNTLKKTEGTVRTALKTINIYVLPLIAVLAGLVAWRIRARRRKAVQKAYAAVQDASREAE